MIVTKTVQISSLLFGVLVLLVIESHSLKPHQQVIKNDCKATDVEWSLLINQVAVLRLLNESSASSLHERVLQEMRDLRLELDVKTRELNNYLLNMKKELQNMTAASLHEIDTKKEELQNTSLASLDEISTKKEEAKQDLKEAVLNASLQQGEKELQEKRELMSDLQDFKTTTMKEMQNMTTMINDINAKNEDTRKTLNELMETVVNLSCQSTNILECEAGWSEYQMSCYKVFKTEVTHDEATDTCSSHGAYLASIGTEGENAFVAGLIETNTFIGLYDKAQEGVFTWQDGSPFSYSKWERGEPNNNGNEDCVRIYTHSYWNDISCGWKRHYVCEKPLQ